jgi:ELWxxDGT repeat protein
MGQDSRARRRRQALSLEALEDRITLSLVPQMVLDINANTPSSSPSGIAVVGSTAYFTADDGVHGVELWKSDGTASGTMLVKDMITGSASSNPGSLTDCNGTLFFSGYDAASGYELWKSDGTAAGTMLIKDIWPGASNSSPTNLTDVNGKLFFTADDGTHGLQVWKSDGTAAGTVQLSSLAWGPSSLTDVNGTLFFASANGVSSELWKSDGTAAGTVLVKSFVPNPLTDYWTPRYLTNANGTLFFTTYDPTHGIEIWKSNGTTAGTVMVKDINPGANSSGDSLLTNVNGTLYFFAGGASGSGLWKSDGTAAGTTLVNTTNFWLPGHLTNVNGTLYFDGTSDTGSELWKSDGTAAGTVQVKDINPGSASSYPLFLTNVNGTLFFSASDATHGKSLWKSDGTAAGTVLVKDIYPERTGYPAFPTLTNVNGTLMLAANDTLHGVELWKSDGTTAGTVLIKDINVTSTPSSSPANVTDVNGTLFFTADDGTRGRELWKSDGTAAGTPLVKDVAPGGYIDVYGRFNPNSSDITNLTNVNGTVFFTTGQGLWKSDGTEAGTSLVASVSARNLTNVNGTVFFAGCDDTFGWELWKSDGTAAGTTLVKDIYPGQSRYYYYYYGYYRQTRYVTNSSAPGNLTNVNGTLFFTADDGTEGQELWKSDGTAAGTVPVKDINPGSASSGSRSLTNVNGTLFFAASDATSGTELWKSNGTTPGTVLVKDINPGGGWSDPNSLTNVNGTLFFSATDDTHGMELWKSDGTAAGTVLVKDINTGGSSSSPTNLTKVNSTLFFTASTATTGLELWKSDGTPAGTVLVKDMNPGSVSSSPSNLTNVNGTLFFTADDFTGVSKLWQSDGTAAGTVPVANLAASSLTNAGGRLYFAADDGIHGQELWTVAAGPGMAVSGLPATITAGVAGSFTVTAKNADGSTNTGFQDTIHFASSDPQAVLPADYSFTAADNGVHTFGVTLKTAGSQFITTSDTALPVVAGTQSGITVNPAAASHFTVAGFPSPRPLGVASVFSVAVADPFGNQVPSYTGTVHFTSTDPLVTVSEPRDYDAALDFSATDNPNGAWRYGWSTALGASFVQDTSHRNVAGIDCWMGEQAGDGNPSVSHNGTADPITPGSMTWQPGQLGFHPGPNGQYSVVRWTAPHAGSLSLAAAFSGLDFVGPTSTDVHVRHNSATLFDGEVNAFGVGPSFDTTVVVAAGDTIDFAVGYGSNHTFNCDTTGLDAFISYGDSPMITNYTFTPADAGKHTFSATFGTAGSQSLTATDTAMPSITGAQQNIEVTPVTSLKLSGFPATITAGAAGNITITAKYADGSTNSGYRGTVHFTSSDPQAVLPADYTFTAADVGVHTFSATLKTAGSQSINVSDTQAFGATGTQWVTTVNPAAAGRFTVAGFPTPITAGTAGSLTLTAWDAYGNRATGYTGTVRFTSSDSKAVLPGNYTFTAADAGAHSFSATLKTAGTQSVIATDTVIAAIVGTQNITVIAAAPSRLILSARSSGKANSQFSLTVTVVDAYGNVATGYRGTLNFRSSDSTASLPTNYTFTAADLGVHTFTGLVLRKKGKQTITVADTLDSSITGSVSVGVQQGAN